VMPPLPVAYGVMLWEGVPPTVVLSEKGKGQQKAYHPGDRIGQFTVVSVSNKEVVFDWDGKEVTARIDDMLQKGLSALNNNNSGAQTPGGSQTPEPRRGTPPPSELMKPLSDQGSEKAPTSTNLSANDTNTGSSLGPGPALPGQSTIHSCVPGDNMPSGTVMNGLQKRVNTTPFSTVCLWEPVR